MKILAIDTSCDETSAAVTDGLSILSNIIWSQASLHTKWGGVVPSIAKRAHEQRIDFIIQKALKTAFPKSFYTCYTCDRLISANIDAVAVTIGPGLAIALEVGIKKAKELAQKFNKLFIPVNHIEGHILSCLAKPKYLKTKKLKNQKSEKGINRSTNFKSEVVFPSIGFVASGGHTEIILIKKIGVYKILAQTSDDALGESLDKAARLLGFGYPGGAILEKIAKKGNPHTYSLPIPLKNDKTKNRLSFSGIKTAFVRLYESIENPTRKQIANLSATFQSVSFQHTIEVLDNQITNNKQLIKNHPILAGGGVVANVTLRKMLRELARKHKTRILFPYSKRLYTDNAAMIGVVAYFKLQERKAINPKHLNNIERIPRVRIDKPLL